MNDGLERLKIPEDLTFVDIALGREAVTRNLLFAPAPLAALCRFNGLDPGMTLQDEDLACWLICEWYVAHREAGGERDPVAEQILTEIAADQVSGIAMLQISGDRPH